MNITHDYLSIPKRLLIELRDNPIAIAIYFFIARLYLVLQRSVPLSRGDIQRFDSAAKTGAIKRALDRLIEGGWLVETNGHKSSYVPAWGRTRAGVPHLWQIGQARLGCPTYVEKIRIDRALLDLFMGRFIPHARNPHIESYFTKPLLSLQDIGAYILIAAELPADTTRELQRWGLVRDGQAQLVPDDSIVLALASQRASVDGFRLTEAGWRKLGWFNTRLGRPAQQEEGTAAPAPLIFVPKERIGSLIPALIGNSIGCSTSHDGCASASESAQTAIENMNATMPGTHGDFQESRDTPPNPPTHGNRSGGGAIMTEEKRNQETTLPDTEAARALFAFGVNDPDCLADLAAMPLEQVGGAITYAKSEDLGPGWVVTALRRHRDEGWPIPQVRRVHNRNGYIDAAEVMDKYGDLFRLGSDTSGLSGFASERVPPSSQPRISSKPAELVPPGTGTATQGPPPKLVRPRAAAAVQDPPLLQPAARRSVAELTQFLRDRLLAQCDRYYHRHINGLQVSITDTTTTIHCATFSDRLAILEALMGALRWHIADLGLPATIRVTEQPPPTEAEPPKGNDPPANGLPLSA